MPISTEVSDEKLGIQLSEYYERNAEAYFKETYNADLSDLYECFLQGLSRGAHILDAGSGSGRDTLAFLRRGYTVSAIDSSAALCALSTRLTGMQTRNIRFQEFESKDGYDGIWACASLLHVPEKELSCVISRFVMALKPGGLMYMSFKHGDGERTAEDGRFFTDMTRERLQRILDGISDMKLKKLWVTTGAVQFRYRGEWLNALVVKCKHGDSNDN